MTVTDLHAALTTIKAALPALEALADADANRATLDAEVAKAQEEVKALQGRLTTMQAEVDDKIKAAEAAQVRVAREHAVAVNFAEQKIQDLRRSEEEVAQRLATTRATFLKEQEAQEAAHRKVEQAHADRVAALVRQANEAAAILAATQEKIQKFHRELAGMAKSA